MYLPGRSKMSKASDGSLASHDSSADKMPKPATQLFIGGLGCKTKSTALLEASKKRPENILTKLSESRIMATSQSFGE